MARKRAENREGSLGFPGFVKPVFTKDSKPLGEGKITRAPRERETRTHLKKVSPQGDDGFEIIESSSETTAVQETKEVIIGSHVLLFRAWF
ncbi:hypothetical protein TNCV_1407621 [Trichonephila clavipes]|nr:hypothetical protein TNCV_1407621 [Trichonephila clavipes]